MKKVLKDEILYPIIILAFTILVFYWKDVFDFLFTEIFAGRDLVANFSIAWLMDNLLNNFKIIGWSNLWFAGTPLFVYYSPLFFIVTSVLSKISLGLIGLKMSYKIIIFLSILLLPVVAYFSSRRMGFDKKQSLFIGMWFITFLFIDEYFGGVNQTLNLGLVAQMFSLNLFLIFIGELFHSFNSKEKISTYITPSLLLASAILSHVYVALYSIIALVIFSLAHFSKRAIKLGFIVLAGGLVLSSFWWLQTLAVMKYSNIRGWNPMDIPQFSMILIVFSLFVFLNFKNDKKLLFLIALFLVLFFIGTRGLPFSSIQYDRFFFISFVGGTFLAGIGSYNLSEFLRGKFLKKYDIVLMAIILIPIVVSLSVPLEQKWESTLEVKGLFGWLQNESQDGRVLVESDVALEYDREVLDSLIPLETGNPTMKNVHVDSTSGKYVMALTYAVSSRPITNNFCDLCSPEIKNDYFILEKLDEFDIRYVVTVTDEAKIKMSRLLEKRYEDDKFAVFENTAIDQYFEVPEYKPILIISDYDSGDYSWIKFNDLVFSDKDLSNKTFVFSNNFVDGDFGAIILLKNIKMETSLPVYKPESDLKSFVKSLRNMSFEKTQTEAKITEFRFNDNEIKFFIDSEEEVPVILKFSYFPSWHSNERIYPTTPSFMMIFGKGKITLQYT